MTFLVVLLTLTCSTVELDPHFKDPAFSKKLELNSPQGGSFQGKNHLTGKSLQYPIPKISFDLTGLKDTCGLREQTCKFFETRQGHIYSSF